MGDASASAEVDWGAQLLSTNSAAADSKGLHRMTLGRGTGCLNGVPFIEVCRVCASRQFASFVRGLLLFHGLVTWFSCCPPVHGARPTSRKHMRRYAEVCIRQHALWNGRPRLHLMACSKLEGPETALWLRRVLNRPARDPPQKAAEADARVQSFDMRWPTQFDGSSTFLVLRLCTLLASPKSD